MNPVRIVGSGLLGASLGLRLRQLGVEVQLEDTSPAALALARDLGAGQIAAEDSEEPELVVVATPPDVAADVVRESLDRFGRAFVTDIASVKARVVEEVERHPGADRYVGSHPMAGRERSGALAADADLFIGRPWVITPIGAGESGGGRPGGTAEAPAGAATEGATGSDVVLAVQQFALSVGALPVVMSPQTHDRSAAVVSHMPQLVSSLVAGALRDVTRIAHSDSRLWATIIAGNAREVARVLKEVSANLDRLIAAVEAGVDDPFALGVLSGVSEAIRRGNEGVERIPGKHGGAPRRYGNVFVLVPDEPGMLGRLFAEVGEIGVNIEDLSLEHTIGREAGRAMLSVLPHETMRLAVALERRGWRVVVEGKENHVGVVIALDGPSGSGKSTVSKKVAERLGLSYLDTGAMYRAAAWHCERRGIDLDDLDAVAEATVAMPLDMPLDPNDQKIVCDGVDVTQAIRESELSRVVSKVATNLRVRAEMKRRQREIIAAAHMGIIAEGRDIATVVAPDADVRVLLTASEETRLARRAREVRGSDDAEALKATRDEVLRRDADDSTVSEFMSAKDGVTEIDSSALGIDEVVEAVVSLVPKDRR